MRLLKTPETMQIMGGGTAELGVIGIIGLLNLALIYWIVNNAKKPRQMEEICPLQPTYFSANSTLAGETTSEKLRGPLLLTDPAAP